MSTPAVVVVTFNRPSSLKRLLGSLAAADYGQRTVPLVISIDYQDSVSHAEVMQLADSFEWKFGEKRVIGHKTNLGLRRHILGCGSLTAEFGSVILLEDDIFVSPQFYTYTAAMLDRYDNDPQVAGISLYKHLWNVNTSRPFIPERDGHDVFFMQFAQSWGQCWSERMWSEFYQWYSANHHSGVNGYPQVPAFVRSWSDKSWLKFFIAYVAIQKKYFVYPGESLSTNFNDVGSHVKVYNCIPQVPLQISRPVYDRLPDISEAVRYDAFFEREGLAGYLGLSENELCIDLYGEKGDPDTRYWLTAKPAPYKIVRSFGLDHRPVEHNVILNNPGNDIFLYDTTEAAPVVKTNSLAVAREILYDIRDLSVRKLSKLLLYKLKSKIR